jgi:predicted PurR-regulated permease PerM
VDGGQGGAAPPRLSAPARTPEDAGRAAEGSEPELGDVARRAFVATIVVLGVAVVALTLWKARLIVTLLFFGVVLAAAMRSGVEALHRRGVPRAVGIGAHYVAGAAFLAVLLWLAVPRAVSQVEQAIGTVPTSRAQVAKEARSSTGLKHELLVGLEKRLRNLPSAGEVVRPALDLTRKALELVVGVFFVLASAAYWIYERERAERLVLKLVPRSKERVVSETWRLVDLKLGAFVRGQLLLVVLVGTVLSLAFWGIGEPYWILLGPFAGIVELVPVVGPLAAGVAAVGVGLTASWHVALAAALVVLGVRLVEDYLVVPRVLGDAVGLSPLVVLHAVAGVGVVLGGTAVLLAVPLAAVLATIVDVAVLDKDPAREEVPTLLFPAGDADRE